MPAQGPRAPSKGALAALRQAALYSSLGVTAGASVLLAEERRRRICIAKRIVDNGRVLKAYSRHVHAVALAEAANADTMHFEEPTDFSWARPQRHPLSSAEIDKAYERAQRRRKHPGRIPDDQGAETGVKQAQRYTERSYNSTLPVHVEEKAGSSATSKRRPSTSNEITDTEPLWQNVPNGLVGEGVVNKDLWDSAKHTTSRNETYNLDWGVSEGSVKQKIRRMLVGDLIVGSTTRTKGSKIPGRDKINASDSSTTGQRTQKLSIRNARKIPERNAVTNSSYELIQKWSEAAKSVASSKDLHHLIEAQIRKIPSKNVSSRDLHGRLEGQTPEFPASDATFGSYGKQAKRLTRVTKNATMRTDLQKYAPHIKRTAAVGVTMTGGANLLRDTDEKSPKSSSLCIGDNLYPANQDINQGRKSHSLRLDQMSHRAWRILQERKLGAALEQFYCTYMSESNRTGLHSTDSRSLLYDILSVDRPDSNISIPFSPDANDDRLRVMACVKLRRENIVRVIDFFLINFPLEVDAKDSHLGEIARVLLQLAAESSLPDPVLSLYLRLQAWGQISPACVELVRQMFQGLLRAAREEDAFLLFSATIGKNLGFDNITSTEELFDRFLRIERREERYDKVLRLVLPLKEAFPHLWTSRVIARCENLLKQSRVAHAANVFIFGIDPETARPETVSMAHRLSAHAQGSGLLKNVKAIFQWTQARGSLDPFCLKQLVSVLAKKKDYESISDLYRTYHDSDGFVSELNPTLCRALALTAPYPVAAAQIGSLLEKVQDHKIHYQKCLSAYLTLLDRCWKETRNIDTVESLLPTMIAHSGYQGPPLKLFNNKILSIRALAGQGPEAISPDLDLPLAESDYSISDAGSVILAHAVKGRWSTVDLIFRGAHKCGLLFSAPEFCTDFFNPILREFCKRHNSREIQRFVLRSISSYSIIPNQMTLDLVLESLVKELRLDAIIPWIHSLHKKGFNLHINAWSVFNVFKRLYLENRPGHLFLMEISRAISQFDRHLLSTEFYRLIEDAIAFDINIYRAYQSKDGKERIQKHLSCVKRWSNESQTLSHRTGIQSKMMLSMAQGKNSEIIETYKQSLDEGLVEYDVALEIAVEAGLRENDGNPSQSLEIIRRSEELGMNIQRAAAPLLFHHIKKSRPRLSESGPPRFPVSEISPSVDSPEAIHRAVLDCYRNMEENNIPPKHYIAVSAAHHLVIRHEAQAAINLLTEIYMSKWAQDMPLQISAMTVFLHAYSRLKNINGIQWVVRTVLKKDLRMDHVFIRVLRQARVPFQRMLKLGQIEGEGPSEKDQEINTRFRLWISLCRKKHSEQRTRTRKAGLELVRIVRHLRHHTHQHRGIRNSLPHRGL